MVWKTSELESGGGWDAAALSPIRLRVRHRNLHSHRLPRCSLLCANIFHGSRYVRAVERTITITYQDPSKGSSRGKPQQFHSADFPSSWHTVAQILRPLHPPHHRQRRLQTAKWRKGKAVVGRSTMNPIRTEPRRKDTRTRKEMV